MRSKAQQRYALRAARLELSGVEIFEKSRVITERLKIVLPWQDAAAIHCFESIKSLNEPDIDLFFSYLHSSHPKIGIYTSRKINNAWRVVQLDGDISSKTPRFDVVIVPMLGFDDSLHRLGYGGGYYDHFLATQLRAQKIGVCFELGHVKGLPVEAHDIPMDVIVTETNIYSRKR